MPRPGPRPYVFERKAWHSDRHQAMRGSLVKEIFRVVNEIHSLATRKNREWQEKLPVVVLKAEEIMYSKANSEAEYMDLKTLCDRTNNAINTIIRRDESTETGKLLQPCIEAALNLGCTARTTLRSQRHCSPRCYLNSSTQETENTTQGNLMVNAHCLANCSCTLKSATTDETQSSFESQKHTGWNAYCTVDKFRFASENCSFPNNNRCLTLEKYSVYPLYDLKPEELQRGFGTFSKSISNVVETAKIGAIENSPPKMNQIDARNTSNNPQPRIACDLSLRLGPLSTPCFSVGNHRTRGVEGSVSTFGYDPLNSSSKSNDGRVEGEHVRKRKTVNGPPMDQQFCLAPKLSYSHSTGITEITGSQTQPLGGFRPLT